jgi:N-acetylneuraminic acid mutarotase
VLVYDPRKGTWQYVAPMRTPREKPRLLQSGRYLYAIGGADGTGRSLASMERYDPVSDSWQFMNSMHESRYAACAVESKVGNRRVFVVIAGVQAVGFMTVGGGYTTEIFDIDTGRWTMLKAMFSRPRGGHGCAVEADGTVLAIGGATRTGAGLAFLRDVDALSLKPKDLG